MSSSSSSNNSNNNNDNNNNSSGGQPPADNQEERWPENVTFLQAYQTSMTGDTLHVAAALALYPNIRVLVIHVGLVGSADGLLNFFRQAVSAKYPKEPVKVDDPSNKRIDVIYVRDQVAADEIYGALAKPIKKNDFRDANGKIIEWKDGIIPTEKKTEKTLEYLKTTVEQILLPPTGPGALVKPGPANSGVNIVDFESLKQAYLVDETGRPFRSMGPVGQTTSAIGLQFGAATDVAGRKALYTLLAEKLSVSGLTADKILKGGPDKPMFGTRPLPDPKQQPSKPIVLLWSRYTGTNTLAAHNPEGDSCVKGQIQLAEMLTKALGAIVITIGHGPRGAPTFSSEFDLGEFYKEKDTGITGDRATQQSFFLALMQKYPGNVFSIGQKTGGMDGAALAGIPTLYLEWKDSGMRARMLKWINAVPFYENVFVLVPPFFQNPPLNYIQDPPAPIARALNQMNKVDLPQPILKPYATLKSSNLPLDQAKLRLIAMLQIYTERMGLKDYIAAKRETATVRFKNIPDSKARQREINSAVFNSIIDFVNDKEEKDLRLDANNSELDGDWIKKMQIVNSDPDLPNDIAGYSDGDMRNIQESMDKLIKTYKGDKYAVIRTSAGLYKTREESRE